MLARRSKRTRDDDFHDRFIEIDVKHAGGALNPGLAKPLPPGLQAGPQSAYGVRAGSGDRTVSPEELDVWLATIEATHSTWHALSRKTDASKDADPYADDTFFFRGWPIAASRKGPSAWPVHCYGSVGVATLINPTCLEPFSSAPTSASTSAKLPSVE